LHLGGDKMSRTFRKAKVKKGKVVRDGDIQPHLVSDGCRNHGNCPWCGGNRRYKTTKKEQDAKEQLESI
jgi:hypothetical protein